MRFCFQPSGLLRDNLAHLYGIVLRFAAMAPILGKSGGSPSHLPPVFVIKIGHAPSVELAQTKDVYPFREFVLSFPPPK